MEDVIEKQDTALENSEEAKSDAKAETKETDWKSEAAKWKRIAQRKAEKDESSDEAPIAHSKEPSDLDYGRKAFLKSSGINGSDEIALVKEFMKRTGDSLDSIVEDDIFKDRLERLRTTKANELAAKATGNNAGTSTGRNSVDYWLAKGEHPPKELGKELAEKYVEAKRGQGKNSKMFYND